MIKVIVVTQEIKDQLIQRFTYENYTASGALISYQCIRIPCALCELYLDGPSNECDPECPLAKYEENSMYEIGKGCAFYLLRQHIVGEQVILHPAYVRWMPRYDKKAKIYLDKIKALIETWQVTGEDG